MKRLLVVLSLLALVALAATAIAQDATPMPGFGPIPTATPRPVATTVPVSSDDPRLALCNAPTLPGFVPYIVRPGDRLADLLTGADNITLTQLAAVNCLDDPATLPAGATIWLPQASIAGAGAGETPPEGTGAAAIQGVVVSSEEVQNREGASVQWRATGEHAYFYPCPADETVECERPSEALPLPLEHTLTLQNFQYAGRVRFRLEVTGEGDPAAQDITLNVVCSNQSLAPVTGAQHCPDEPPLAVFGVWQPFERGVMVYFSDTSEIYVMTNADHRVQVFPDTFEEGMEDVEYEDVPDGRFPARRGFGIVWNALGGPESALGWGLAEEIGFDSARQPAGRISYTTYIQGPGATVYAVTFVPNDAVGYWVQVAG